MGVKNESSSSGENPIDLFLKIGLDEKTAKNTVANNKVTANLTAVIHEKSMYNAWVATLKLRHSVKSKRVELQRLRQSLKLYSILKRQMLHLDVWNRIDRDHGSSLLGATEALEASTLQLPVGDIQDVKDAICSVVEMMQTMVSSIGVWSTKVDHVSLLASAIANTSAKENALLYQCQDLMSTLTALQVKDCSIKTHMLQVIRVPSNLKTQV